MYIESLNNNEFGVLGYSSTPGQNIENSSRNDEEPISKSGWRKFRSEAAHTKIPHREKELRQEQQLQLEKCLEEALHSNQYEKALEIFDQIIDTPDEYRSERSRFRGLNGFICLLSEKALCLEDLGRLEEAYLCYTEALSKVPFLYEEMGKAMLDQIEEMYIAYNNNPYNESIPVEEKEKLFPKLEDLLSEPFIKEILGMKIQEIQNDLLISRGFLSLKLKEKNSAIDDFRKAASSEYGIVEEEDNPEFLFRVLEKSLGVQIAPVKDYEKEIETLLGLEKVYDVCDQLMMFYALTGQHDKASEWYEKIKDKGHFRPEIPFFLAYLKGDMETAKKALDYYPDSNYKLIMNPEL